MVKLKVERPLSPYLTVYKPQISSLLSILERISGVFIFIFLSLYLVFVIGFFEGLSFYDVYAASFFINLSESFFFISLVIFLFFNIVYHCIFTCRFLFWYISSGLFLGIELSYYKFLFFFFILLLFITIFLCIFI
jgi:succinate dehydrogenase / fumarate reductase cytochrome b subunit